MAKDHFFEQISDYLDGNLQPEEQGAFEDQLKKDHQLAKELELYKEIQQELSNEKVLKFRKSIHSFNEKYKEKSQTHLPPTRLKSLRFILSVAAGIILLLAAGIWFFSPTSSAQELLATYVETLNPTDILPAQYSSGIRSVIDSTIQLEEDSLLATNWHKARIFFAEKKYDSALNAMIEVKESEVIDPSSYYYELGILYLINKQPAEAITTLQKMETDKSGGKNWYLALSYLALNQIDLCREQLTLLTKEDNPWYEEASTLLKSLP